MATDNLMAGKSTLDYTPDTTVDVNLSAASTPLPQNPGVLSHVKSFFGNIFGDYYNSFRLVGYLAEINYSAIEQFFIEKVKIPAPKDFKPRFWFPDWKSKPRMAMNGIEAGAFMVTALVALFRDRKKIHNEIAVVVGAEQGKNANDITLKDTYNNDNPLVQTMLNRSKGLYLLRLLQPLTFGWSSKLGISTTVFEIIAERAAYFEKNSYDLLQKLTKEVSINQLGAWSKGGIAERLVEIVQQNRAEHKAQPIRSQDIEAYLPVFNAIAERLIEKKWHFAETLYVLGQLIRQPQDKAKVDQAVADIEQFGLNGISQHKQIAPVATPVLSTVSSDNHETQVAGTIQVIGFANKLGLKPSLGQAQSIPPASHMEKVAQQIAQVAPSRLV